MPVEAASGRVVIERTAGRLEDACMRYCTASGGCISAGRDHGLDVDAGGVALQDAVGEEGEAVARLQR